MYWVGDICKRVYKHVKRCRQDGELKHTADSASSAAAAKMINNGSITFDQPIYSKITSVSGIGNLLVFQDLDGRLDSIDGSPTILQKGHGDFCGTITIVSCSSRAVDMQYSIEPEGQVLLLGNLLCTCSQMGLFVLHTMIPCTCVHKDGTDVSAEPLFVAGHVRSSLWLCQSVQVQPVRVISSQRRLLFCFSKRELPADFSQMAPELSWVFVWGRQFGGGRVIVE
jgi:hypothetical protein